MRKTIFATILLALGLSAARSADAGTTYVALGDSITFGETDLKYVPSNGDRGYVGLYADHLGALTGTRPQVFNFAIDGETSTSFFSGAGRVPPVVGRTDAILAAENTHYNPASLVSQNAQLLSTLAAQKAAGNSITTVSISLGDNDLFTLASMPATANALLAPTLATFRSNYSSVLSEIRQSLPTANLLLIGYYNPIPADPTNPGGSVITADGPKFNAVIKSLAVQFHGAYVDTATPFVGHEAAYTYLDEMPHGSQVSGPFGGTLPLGNVHPNATGYAVIAGAAESATTSVPLPSALASSLMTVAGFGAMSMWTKRRRASV